MGTISVSTPSDGQTIDAADVNNPINTIVSAINGNLDDDNIKTGANISGTKIAANTTPLSALDAASRGGWIAGVLSAPNTITYNGNRNYSVVFNSTDLTDEISNGMRLKLTRTVTAQTQCTDLESGSSQYYSKTSPAGMTFTDDFTCMAWIKLESYTAGGIICRRNADTEGWSFGVNSSGQVVLAALRIAGNNATVSSYASLPLNKWVHVAASYDLSGTTAAVYFDGVAVDSLKTVTGTCTALVQGTSALNVGAQKSGGTEPFDGKIAQAAVFSTVLSAATVASYSSQTLSGSETSLVSAYSFNNVITDLNTSNANNLTANGSAVATNADSPFAGGASASTAYTAGTTEFAEVFNVAFSTNTTLTVQVPDGYAIPTSGGVSAVSYSTAERPLGWPGLTVIGYAQSNTDFTLSSATPTQISGLSCSVYVPAGRRVRVSVYSPNFANNTNTSTSIASLWRGVVNSGTQIQGGNFTVARDSQAIPGYLIVVESPTSGSQTYNAGLAASANQAKWGAAVAQPAYILVELV